MACFGGWAPYSYPHPTSQSCRSSLAARQVMINERKREGEGGNGVTNKEEGEWERRREEEER